MKDKSFGIPATDANPPAFLPAVEPLELLPPGAEPAIDPRRAAKPEDTAAPPSARRAMAAAAVTSSKAAVIRPVAFRCLNCLDERGKPGRMFEGENPVCPGCKLDGRLARFERFIVPVALIHFDPPHSTVARQAENAPACGSAKQVAGLRATGEILAVTCPKCLASDVGASALAGRPAPNVPAEADYVYGTPTPAAE